MLRSWTLPIVERAVGTRFWTILKNMKRTETLSDKEQFDLQRAKLSGILTHAISTTPHWSNRYANEIGHNLSNEQVPKILLRMDVLSKADIRNGFPQRVTSGDKAENWRYGSSAGTVDRVTVITDFSKRDHIRATNFRVVEKLLGDPFKARIAEVPPDACNVVCALRDEGPLELLPFVRWALKKGILFKRSTRPDLRGRLERSFFIRQTTLEPVDPQSWDAMAGQLDEHLRRLVECKPNILRGLPLFLLWLGQRAKETGVFLPTLKAILPYGGLMSGEMARRVSEAFAAPFFDFYGTSELGGVALQSHGERGMRVFHDQVLVEVLDDENRPLPPGCLGRIVVTDYHNYAMPLIRYEVGDVGRWLSDDEETDDQFALNRHARLEVMGRHVETSVHPSDRIVTSREVMDTLFADESILNATLEGRSMGTEPEPRYTLKAMSKAGMAAETLPSIQELLELSRTIKFRDVQFLRPEKSGKYQVFKPHSAKSNQKPVSSAEA